MNNQMVTENSALNRRIRKHIYGKNQTFEIECSPGFSELCKKWAEQILANFLSPADYEKCSVQIKNGRVLIENAPFDVCHELLLRGQPFTDVKIQIVKGRCSSIDKLQNLLERIDWDLWVSDKTNITWDIRVDSLRSQLYNEKKLKTLCLEFLDRKFAQLNSDAPLPVGLDLNIEREVLSLSISLGGRTFWQRGLKNQLVHAAPLREDLAACLVSRMHDIGQSWGLPSRPDRVINPFCGTGTLLHESAIFLSGLGNLLNRSSDWTYLKLPFFRKSAFFDRLKKIRNVLKQSNTSHQSPMLFQAEDIQSEYSQAAYDWFESSNLMDYQPVRLEKMCVDSAKHADSFFSKDCHHLWIVSNPPFGLRLSNSSQGGTEALYRQYAERIANLSHPKESSAPFEHQTVLGVVLCPDEACWRIMQSRLKNWRQKCEHLTLGGLDIRAFYFGITQHSEASLVP